MSELFFARAQMGMSLAFHIVFAVLGIGMPLLMVICEILHQRTGHQAWLELAKRWAAGTAIIFAVGAVSGTVLSFELGLLWPGFMAFAGGVIGLPFALEGFAFFTEAIFLGIYLYGWRLVPPRMHIAAGIVVALSGAASAVFVVSANAWMNTPAGFTVVDGAPTAIDPIAAMLNPAAVQQIVHMVLACYVATGFAVAGVHAFHLLRHPDHAFHRRGLGAALAMGMIAIPLQFLSGDLIARMVAREQPVKFAAMEAHFQTAPHAPLTLGGIVDQEAGIVHGAIEIPGMLSLLAHHDPAATVTGLDSVDPELWPPVAIVHWSFDIMVACGSALLAVAIWAAWSWWRQGRRMHARDRRDDLAPDGHLRTVPQERAARIPDGRGLLRALVLCTPLGFIAIETGWFVTEFGRQPWVIVGIMRTAEAATPVQGLGLRMLLFALTYLFLAVILVVLLRRQFRAATRWHPEQSDD
ncbi:MAG: cytochrome ubiquinol oxidase subunit I [Planctomycetota bacterium]